jgi:UDP-N-acetylmuramyl pentapeptide synthase
MKKIILKIIWWMLRAEACLVLKLKKPQIIAVTGSIAKTSTKDAIYWILKDEYHVWKSPGNVNAEFGVPLTILGSRKEKGPGKLEMLWLPIWGKLAMIKNIFSKYPKILIIEMGIEHKGDIKYFTKLAKPHISVVTSISPVHLVNFKDVEGVYQEKTDIVRGLSKNNYVVLNKKDQLVERMAKETSAKVIFYEADPIELARKAAIATTEIFGIFQEKAKEKLKTFIMPKSRFSIIKMKHYTLIDDSYNSNPLATTAVLNELSRMKAKRKVGILGDMLELADYTEKAHNEIGELAGKVCDLVIFVGENSEYFEEGALKNLDEKYIKKVKSADEAVKIAQEIIQPGDLILVKGSRKIGLEKVVEELKKIESSE